MQREITAWQFYILTFGLTVGTSILVTPAGLAHSAREDAWLASLCSMLFNLLMVGLYLALSKLYPGKTIFEMLESGFGKWLGKAVAMLYLFYYLILTGTLVGNLGFFITSEMMTETPIEAIQILFLIAAAMCARLGIVILARMGELIFPLVVSLFLVLVLALLPQIDWDYIRPMLEDGWTPVVKAGFHSAMFQELVVLLTVLPLVQRGKASDRAYVGGAMTGGTVLILVVLLSVLVMGIEQTENSSFPAFALAKMINVGNFFQRVEGIFITIWVMTFFIKISLLIISLLWGLQAVFGLKGHLSLVYPMLVLIIIVAWNTYINTVYINEIIEKVWSGYSMLYLLFFPLCLYAVGRVKKSLSHK